ncbi:MAG: hypothetical protein AB9903_17205 [Vulcanimicrobiota bacterium]
MIRVSLSENRRKSLPARFLSYWYIIRKQKDYELSEFPAPAVITLTRCPVRLAKAGFLDRLASLWKLPMELSLTPVPSRFLIRTAAFIIILGGLLNGGSARVGDSDAGPAPRKEKGSFPPCSWDDFRGRNTSPHGIKITECPLSIRLAGKAYAAIDCITSSDVHTFNLTHDAHSNSDGVNNHTNSGHSNTDPDHNQSDHTNSDGHSNATHRNMPP